MIAISAIICGAFAGGMFWFARKADYNEHTCELLAEDRNRAYEMVFEYEDIIARNPTMRHALQKRDGKGKFSK